MTYSVLVDRVEVEAERIISLTLTRPDGTELAAWSPGAHIDVVLPSGLVRQYSLCGDPQATHSYRIAVLKEPSGRGGSREIHETDLLGRVLRIRGPRNHFELVPATSYLFIAGGIGITPLVAMSRAAGRSGIPWRLAYGARTLDSMAFVPELQQLDGGSVRIVPQDQAGLLPLAELIDGCEPDTAVYCCGPEAMIRAAEVACESRDRLSSLHVERFSASSVGQAEQSSLASRGGFDVELRRSSQVLWVPADRSILDVIREVRADVLSSCEEGFCGACESTVLEGIPEHHDTILSDEERQRGATMMICVGRSKTPRLVLDL